MVKALFRKGSPGGKGKPSRTAQTRKDGGWFGGAGRAPDVPMDADVVTAEELDTYATGLARNGFFGPDSWYMNADRNLDYASRDQCGRILRPTDLFLHADVVYTVQHLADAVDQLHWWNYPGTLH